MGNSPAQNPQTARRPFLKISSVVSSPHGPEERGNPEIEIMEFTTGCAGSAVRNSLRLCSSFFGSVHLFNLFDSADEFDSDLPDVQKSLFAGADSVSCRQRPQADWRGQCRPAELCSSLLSPLRSSL